MHTAPYLAAAQKKPFVVSAEDRVGQPISTQADFAKIALNPRGHYYLTNDITFTSDHDPDTCGRYFYGVLDMSGYTIHNMNVVGSATQWCGLFFEMTNGAVVMNGRFKNCTVTQASAPAQWRGVLAGVVRKSVMLSLIFEGCTVNSQNANSSTVCGYSENSVMQRVADVSCTLVGGSASNCRVLSGSQGGLRTDNLCYYNTNIWNGAAPTAAITGKTDAQMKTAADWSGWNYRLFNKVDGSYPTFNALVYNEIYTRSDFETAWAADSDGTQLYRFYADVDFTGSEFNHLNRGFQGDLDLNGFSITNMERGSVTGARHGVMMRTMLKNGMIRNGSVQGRAGFTATSSVEYKGLICGQADRNSLFLHTEVKGTITTGGDRAGGLSGISIGGVFVKCHGRCYVGNTTRIGAICGFDFDDGWGAAWGWGNVNMYDGTYGSGNGSLGYYDHPTYPVSTTSMSASAAYTNTEVTLEPRYWSPDLWKLDTPDGAFNFAYINRNNYA